MTLTKRQNARKPSPAVVDVTDPAVPLRLLEASVVDRIDDYVDQAIRRVAQTVPTLGTGSTVNLSELRTAVYCVVKTSLTNVTRERGPVDREQTAWRQLGKRAAQLGVPLEDVTQALRVCCTTLWEALSQAALRLGGQCPYGVLTHAPALWEHFDVMASAVSQAHHDVGTVRDIEESQLVCAFLAAVRRHPVDIDSAEGLARALGFDPNGWFVAVVHQPVLSRPQSPTARLVAAEEADRTIMFAQSVCPSPQGELEAAAAVAAITTPRAGVGIQRTGLSGLHQSLIDAETAYRAAGVLNAAVVDFRTQWLSCLAIEHRQQHEALVADAVECLRGDDGLRRTVGAYLSAEGSLPGAAATLGLHANTVAYRLRQLAERTGLDARSADGAALARVALAFTGMAVPQSVPSPTQAAS